MFPLMLMTYLSLSPAEASVVPKAATDMLYTREQGTVLDWVLKNVRLGIPTVRFSLVGKDSNRVFLESDWLKDIGPNLRGGGMELEVVGYVLLG